MGLLTKDLSEGLAKRFKGRGVAHLAPGEKPEDPQKIVRRWEQAKIWIVFGLCFVCSLVGVIGSFTLFGTTITGTRKWGFALVVSVIMLGLSYGAKYSNTETRKLFTPVDVLQYVSQGVLWPSTWPALAQLIGIQPIAGPAKAFLIKVAEQILGTTMFLS